MSQPEIASDSDKMQEASTAYQNLSEKLERAYTRWAELSDEIEKVTAELDS